MSAYKTITSNNVTVSSTLTFPNRVTINNMPTGLVGRALVTSATGIPSFQTLPIAGVSAGSNGQTLVTSSLTPTWSNRSWASIWSYSNISSANWNATSNLSFSGAGQYNSSIGTTTTLIPTVGSGSITFNSNTIYDISIQAELTNTSANTIVIRLDPLVNGVTPSGNPVSITWTLPPNSTHSYCGMFTPMLISSGGVFTVRTNNVSGVGTVTNSTANSKLIIQNCNGCSST